MPSQDKKPIEETQQPSKCKQSYEVWIPEEQRTTTKWHLWKMAWNAAVRATITTTSEIQER
jgi:hypothetical protein